MSISYKKLFDLMEERGVKKTHLRYDHHINHKVIANLAHNRSVNVNSIMRLCEIFDCQPGDIMEYVKDPEPQQHEEKAAVLIQNSAASFM